MADKSAIEVFEAISDLNLLGHIAEKRNIEISEKEKTKKQIAKRLAADISALGLERVLSKLPKGTLDKLSESIPVEEGDKKTQRQERPC